MRNDGSTHDPEATAAAARDGGSTRRTVHADGSVSVLAEESRDLTGDAAAARTTTLRKEEAIPERLRDERDSILEALADVEADISSALSDPERYAEQDAEHAAAIAKAEAYDVEAPAFPYDDGDNDCAGCPDCGDPDEDDDSPVETSPRPPRDDPSGDSGSDSADPTDAEAEDVPDDESLAVLTVSNVDPEDLGVMVTGEPIFDDGLYAALSQSPASRPMFRQPPQRHSLLPDPTAKW
ncbi:hypothetical protein LCGC14_0834700 [marine sediment metagenome]|uniref:Uncharacterized protein n=1 Tax=marine sediment metagenome TaxID=412755 RepID=A0A0F9Q065_9ZZZZ